MNRNWKGVTEVTIVTGPAVQSAWCNIQQEALVEPSRYNLVAFPIDPQRELCDKAKISMSPETPAIMKAHSSMDRLYKEYFLQN